MRRICRSSPENGVSRKVSTIFIASHHGVRAVDVGEIRESLFCHAGKGLAARALVGCEVRAAVDPVDGTILAAQFLLHLLVYTVDVGHRAKPFAHALLIGNQQDTAKIPAQRTQSLKDTLFETEIVEIHHIATHNLLVDDSVAVQKKSRMLLQKY